MAEHNYVAIRCNPLRIVPRPRTNQAARHGLASPVYNHRSYLESGVCVCVSGEVDEVEEGYEPVVLCL